MSNPEIGKSIQLGEVATNYHDIGDGAPVLLRSEERRVGKECA